MKTNLGIITIIGLIGSIASIISLFSSKQFLSDNQIHWFYGIAIIIITIISSRLILLQRNKIDILESTDEKIKEHFKKYPFHRAEPAYYYSRFLHASKSFINNNKDFFSNDYNDLLDLANRGIEYGETDSTKQEKHYQYALELKSKIESHLIRL